jgi:hypothetical protein
VAPTNFTALDFAAAYPPLRHSSRGAALDGKSEYASFGFQPYGWEIQMPQPPHPKISHYGPTIRSDDGLVALVAPPPPPPPLNESTPYFTWQRKRGAVLDVGDQGDQRQFVTYLPTVAWQPTWPDYRHPRWYSPTIGDQGTYRTFLPVIAVWGHEMAPAMYSGPQALRHALGAALARGDEGIVKVYITNSVSAWGGFDYMWIINARSPVNSGRGLAASMSGSESSPVAPFIPPIFNPGVYTVSGQDVRDLFSALNDVRYDYSGKESHRTQ